MPDLVDMRNRAEVLSRVLDEWLLRELRDELVSRVTWKNPALHELAPRLRVRLAPRSDPEVYMLCAVGMGGDFFYEHPVGESLYAAKAEVLAELWGPAASMELARQAVSWAGASGEPKGYRFTEGMDELVRDVVGRLEQQLRAR